MSPAETPGTSTPPAPWRRDLLVLALGFGILVFLGLGRAPLGNPDEGRYAEIPREMIASGDWVTPRLDGVAYFEKPPLMYWAVAACIEAFGPNAWAVRTAPALFALAGILLTYAAARKLRGREAGLWSAVVLGTSVLYFGLAHLPIIDMAVSVLMAAALFSFILGVREPPGTRRRLLFYGLYAAAALATLAKGLIGFVLPGAVMFLWLLIFDQWKRLRPFHLPTGLLLFLAVAAPWHLAVASRNPSWAHFYFVHEHWERFTTTEHGRVGPWWYFVPVVILGLFPWIGFLQPALGSALAGGWSRRRENADAWFLVVWAAFIFLFFSKSQSKLIPYILPVFPPLAVLIGSGIPGIGPRGRDRAMMGFRCLCGLIAAAALVAVFKPGLIRDPVAAAELRPWAVAVAAILVAGGFLARRPAGVAATGALFLSALVLAEPLIPLRSTKPLAIELRELVRPGDRVFSYHEFFHDFTFYAGRTVDVVAFQGELEPQNDPRAREEGRFVTETDFRRIWDGPGRVFAVARKSDVAELFASPGFHYRLLGETRDATLFSNQP
jgi:4-amino-4-deoxy-L-arabinose transferase-like glycosyltransferase